MIDSRLSISRQPEWQRSKGLISYERVAVCLHRLPVGVSGRWWASRRSWGQCYTPLPPKVKNIYTYKHTPLRGQKTILLRTKTHISKEVTCKDATSASTSHAANHQTWLTTLSGCPPHPHGAGFASHVVRPSLLCQNKTNHTYSKVILMLHCWMQVLCFLE